MAYLRILNQSLQAQAIIDKVLSPKISEEINREFSFNFSTVIDGEKSQYINHQHIAEVENNYFDIAYVKGSRNSDSTLTMEIECDHVSYRLSNEDNILEGFTAYGTCTQLLTTLLAGTGFTVGTVEFTTPFTISINEKTTRRAVLLAIAAAYSGELKFDKFQISLLIRRGADRGVQFRHKKNNISASWEMDNRGSVNGIPEISYEVNVAELEFAVGYGSDEHYELGDTVKVIDEGLGVNITARIVKHEYNPFQRMQGEVTIANFIEDIFDVITKLQQTTVVKDIEYNDCSIGPKYGFVATKSDKKARTLMNGTDGFKIQQGDGSGDNWIDVVFIDTNGNAVYKGKVSAAEIKSSTIDGGSITGATIIGNIIKTAASGGRIEFTANDFSQYDSNGIRRLLINAANNGTFGKVVFYDASGNEVGAIFGGPSQIALHPSVGGLVSVGSGNTDYVDINGQVKFQSVGKIGFFGQPPQSKQNISSLSIATAGSTYTANERTMLQDVYNKVIAIWNALYTYGLI